jgi:hypothetical protein
LFLLPLPWWGPVLAPILISLLMIFWGTFASLFERDSGSTLSNWRVWALCGIGVALMLYVFMMDALAAAPRGLEAVRVVLPEKFNWPLFGLALALMSTPLAQRGRRLLLPPTAKVEIIEAIGKNSCPRCQKN